MKLRNWFHNQPIQRKLSGISTLVTLVALLPIASVLLGYEYRAAHQAAVHEVKVLADIIRDNSAATLAFQDQPSATEVLETLRASPNIAQAVLILTDGSLYAQYVQNGGAADPKLWNQLSDSETVSWKSIRVARSVHLKAMKVGWLVIDSHLDAFYARIQLYALVIFLSIMVGLGLARYLSLRLITSITDPLSLLVTLTHDVAEQKNYTLRNTIERKDEIGDLSQAFNNMLSHIHARDAQLNQLAYYDNVTGLTNRHYFKERAEQAVGNALRYCRCSCLMFIDLDRFKAVNDTFGHDIGDELLRAVAQRLTQTLRNNDVVCRIGGDEFAVVLENVASLDDVGLLAQKMVHALAQSFLLLDHEVFIGASIGISACPDHAASMNDLLRCADIAMYQAKALGRGQFCIYSPHLEAGSHRGG